jgi:integron integrase
MNESPKELLGKYESYLKSRKMVPERQVPFFVRWLKRFLCFQKSCKEEPFDRVLDLFAANLEKDRRIQDWQVSQAIDAVKIYRYRFASGSEGAMGMEGSGRGGEEDEATDIEKIMDRLREIIRIKHYSSRTEKSYLGWTRRFLEYWLETREQDEGEQETPEQGEGETETGKQGSRLPTQDDVRAFLSHLALERRVSASTQNQAFNALLFLYRTVLGIELTDMGENVRAKRGSRLPVVLSVEETRNVIDRVEEPYRLMVKLLYGGGLRVSELVDLRVKDIDFENGVLIVKEGKGDKDRTTLLPRSLCDPLREHLEAVKKIWEKDLERGYGEAPLPDALHRKYPDAGRQWGWQYAFPAYNLAVHPEDGTVRRFRLTAKPLQRAVRRAVEKAGITKRASVHTFRHCFATHLLLQGTDIREVQELMGHTSVETTMKYLHVVRELRGRARSPLDNL